MSEFDAWFKESYPTQYAFKDSTPTCKSFYDGAKLGAQSQQAKIDELKMSNHHLSVQLVDSNAHYDHVKKERDELQGRIDGALSAVWNDKCSHRVIDILKGNKDD